MSLPPWGREIREGLQPTEEGATVGPDYLTIGASGGPGLLDHCHSLWPKTAWAASSPYWPRIAVAALWRSVWGCQRCAFRQACNSVRWASVKSSWGIAARVGWGNARSQARLIAWR